MQVSVYSRISSRSLHVMCCAKRIDFENTVKRYAASQELVTSCIVKNVADRLRSETRLSVVWLDNPRKPSKELIVTKY